MLKMHGVAFVVGGGRRQEAVVSVLHAYYNYDLCDFYSSCMEA